MQKLRQIRAKKKRPKILHKAVMSPALQLLLVADQGPGLSCCLAIVFVL